MKRRSTIRWIVLSLSGLFIGFVIYGSLQLSHYECEVCITFRSRTSCRTVAGITPEEARASAVNNACAQISSGVTDSIACERTPPDRAECRQAS